MAKQSKDDAYKKRKSSLDSLLQSQLAKGTVSERKTDG